ncbi:MAG: glycoside hydrolase, family 13 domain protein [Candidatus Ozemobacter sibiricus]|uniref:Glycoside hydrolase, family 13 domain protein n=1 Tax=Candidatus Ozemobacter sibiricus TaxID=2268124 RepID=A0A367ZP50_9BACT|nr:MAG: glycoside hydrolase, family 13 domain protein [Candidatus Ozemobacter sibiricus]
MIRLLRFIWKLFILASAFGIGYIIGREHSFEEEEDWDSDEEAGTSTGSTTGTGAADEKKPETPAPATESQVEFTYTDPKATAVAVVGDFNDWNKDKNPMQLVDGVWKATVALKPGRHEYKFVVNNTDWITDPKSAETVADKYGGRSSIVVVP